MAFAKPYGCGVGGGNDCPGSGASIDTAEEKDETPCWLDCAIPPGVLADPI